MAKNEIDTFCPRSQREWRRWLSRNHQNRTSIWLILYKKDSGKPVIRWSDAVDEALCFGWIDSTRRPVDEKRFMQFFAKRKPTATWSKINKAKVQRLIEQGLMTPAGLASIEEARRNGAWTILDSVEALRIPTDFSKALKATPGATRYFTGLGKSVRKRMLHWLVLAKRPETRQKRIGEIVRLAAQGKKPKQF